MDVVLDNDCFRGFNDQDVRRLVAASGDGRVQLSEIALAQAVVQARRRTREDGRVAGRALLFSPIRRWRGVIDSETPLAVGGGVALDQVRARVAGQDDPPDVLQRVRENRAVWAILTGLQPTDQQLDQMADEAEALLESVKAGWLKLCRPDSAIWAGIPRETLEALGPAIQEWKDAPEDAQLAATVNHVAASIGIGADAAQRHALDGVVRVIVYRLHNTAKGRITPKTRANDGADLAMLVHVADGATLLTRDTALIADVRRSGTWQAPLVCSLDDFAATPP